MQQDSHSRPSLFEQVRQIISKEWDPIGFTLLPKNMQASGEHEYNPYIHKIVTILEQDKSTIDDLVAYLEDIRNYMGLPQNRNSDSKAAEKLFLAAKSQRRET